MNVKALKPLQQGTIKILYEQNLPCTHQCLEEDDVLMKSEIPNYTNNSEFVELLREEIMKLAAAGYTLSRSLET